MLDRNYYVLRDDNCRFEGMTKEQVIAAIAEATGATPTHIDDAFITKLKEQNRNTALKFWVGTTAQYNALEEVEEDCFYILTDDTFADDVNRRFDEVEQTIVALDEKVDEIHEASKTLTITDHQTGDYNLVTYFDSESEQLVHIPIINGLYMVRVVNPNNSVTFSFIMDFQSVTPCKSIGGSFASPLLNYNNINYLVFATATEPVADGEFVLNLYNISEDKQESNCKIFVRQIGSQYAVG